MNPRIQGLGIPDPPRDAFRVAIQVSGAGVEFYEPGDLSNQSLSELATVIAEDYRLLTGADRAWLRPIDPETGASGCGLEIVLDFFSFGANTITWIGASIYISNALKAALQRATREIPSGSSHHRPTLSGAALQVIAVADLLITEGLRADQVVSVENFSLSSPTGEDRPEMRDIYAVHVIGIQVQDEGISRGWVYVVYADGSVVARVSSTIPGPKGPSWSEITSGLAMLGPVCRNGDG